MISEKTIILDLSEVIIRGILGIENELAPILNLEAGEIISGFGGDNLRNICVGKLSEKDYFQTVIEQNKWEITIQKMIDIVRNNFNFEIPGMPSYIYELSKRNSLILYSDHAKEWITYIQKQHSFLHVFKEKVYSFEQNCLKSDNDAFPLLLQRLNLGSSDVIFIDDNIENIRNAISTGIDSIHFTSCYELQISLEEKLFKNKSAEVCRGKLYVMRPIRSSILDVAHGKLSQ